MKNKRLIILFGSQVIGRANALSDFDIAVLCKNILSLTERTNLCHYLSNKFKINEDLIDLVDIRTASPLLLYEIAKTGKLMEGENSDFIKFKIRAWKIYQDTAKFRKLDKLFIKKFISKLEKKKVEKVKKKS